VDVEPAKLQTFWFTSTAPKPNRVLLFSVAEALSPRALGPYRPNAETSERGLVFGPEGLDAIFAFPLHVQAARRFFAEHAITGNHDYVRA
jgi:hypothetical protein